MITRVAFICQLLKMSHYRQGTVEITVSAHDTTGGMETKIMEAACIAKIGIDVYITKVKKKTYQATSESLLLYITLTQRQF